MKEWERVFFVPLLWKNGRGLLFPLSHLVMGEG
jgi:hypothetical protein